MPDQDYEKPSQILYGLYEEFSEEKNELLNQIHMQESELLRLKTI